MSSPANRQSKPVRILVVDDHPFFREGLIRWLNHQQDLVCCGEASDAPTARDAVQKLKPDLVLLDLRLKDADGLELIKQLLAQSPELRILVISQNDESIYAERVIRAGAKGYIMKEEATQEVLAAIRTVMGGESHVSPAMAARILKRYVAGAVLSEKTGLSRLSDRELQVFQLLGAGLGTKKIAEELGLSGKTIETYRENIKNKLNLADAAALIRAATAWVLDGADPCKPGTAAHRKLP